MSNDDYNRILERDPEYQAECDERDLIWWQALNQQHEESVKLEKTDESDYEK